MSLVPYVVEQTSRGERSYDIFSRLLNDRIVMLCEEVNDTTASLVVTELARKGVLVRSEDPADRRRRIVDITPDSRPVISRWRSVSFTPLGTEIRIRGPPISRLPTTWDTK